MLAGMHTSRTVLYTVIGRTHVILLHFRGVPSIVLVIKDARGQRLQIQTYTVYPRILAPVRLQVLGKAPSLSVKATMLFVRMRHRVEMHAVMGIRVMLFHRYLLCALQSKHTYIIHTYIHVRVFISISLSIDSVRCMYTHSYTYVYTYIHTYISLMHTSDTRRSRILENL